MGAIAIRLVRQYREGLDDLAPASALLHLSHSPARASGDSSAMPTRYGCREAPDPPLAACLPAGVLPYS
jgi:hypothetical protein